MLRESGVVALRDDGKHGGFHGAEFGSFGADRLGVDVGRGFGVLCAFSEGACFWGGGDLSGFCGGRGSGFLFVVAGEEGQQEQEGEIQHWCLVVKRTGNCSMKMGGSQWGWVIKKELPFGGY